MITFKTLKIKDFKSIKQADLTYSKGVWLVTGINNDSVFTSNGAGKSTALEAIQQCLFNKTTSPTPIDDTSRKVEGVVKHTIKYKLELELSINNDTYVIINDRKLMHIRVIKNHEDMMFKSIPQSLKFIQELLGMDFQTFVTLTFINNDTIVGLLDNFSSSSLMKVILNFSQISSFEKRAKLEQKVLNSSMLSIQNQISTLEDSLKALEMFSEIDITPIVLRKIEITGAKQHIVDSDLPSIEFLEARVTSIENHMSNNLKEHRKIDSILTSSVCECCGTLLTITEDQIEKYKVTQSTLRASYKDYEESLAETSKEASDKRKTYMRAISDYDAQLDSISKQITVVRTKNELYAQTKEQSDNLAEQLANCVAKRTVLQTELDVIQSALFILKAGDIQKSLLQTFVVVLNKHLTRFVKFVSLDYVVISAESSKANVSFKIQDTRFSQVISIHTLSGGEKTRLRLVVLLAMLYTIKDLAEISTNLLVFDESLDTLDVSATKDLANLFSYLVHNDEKFIAMVSHGAQLNEIDFTGTLTAIKTNGITNLEEVIL